MMPPTRIEQLNNFQDAVQSPDGLDRLRALQAVEQALPSSQGLMGMPQVQAPMPMVPRQYGGEVGTGGLVEVLDDGTQVFDRTEEGILNRSLHGGMLEGQTQTASAPSSFSGGTDAPGTLASGTTAPSGFTIETGQDKYGNTIGDLTGMQDYYDLNFAARDAGQDTFMYGDKLMQVDPGYLRGGGINPFISNRLPAGLQQEVIDRPDLFTKVDNLFNLNTIQKKQGDPTDPGFYSEAPYLPTQDFSRDISGQYNSYYEANQAAKEAGSPTFMWGDKLAKTDPGLLPDYVGGPKPFISNAIPEKYISAGVNLPPGWANMSANQLAKYQPGYKDPNRITYGPAKHGGQVIKKEGGGQIDPSQAAQGLASFGRYGDNILVHMNPEELQGLASLGNITYNPVTGLPEAFSLKGIFKAVRKLAPVALAIAAPYAFPTISSTALGFGLTTGGGAFLGNLIAGAKPKDALKGALFSGLTAGVGSYLGGAPSGFGGSGASNVGTQGFANTGLGGINQGVTPNIAGASSAGTNLTKASFANTGYGGINKLQPSSIASEFTSPPTTTGLSNRVIDVPKQSFQLAQTQPVQPTFNPDIPTNMTIRGDSLNQYVQSQQPVAKVAPQQSIGIFDKGGLSSANLKRIGQDIYKDYANPKGIAKLVAMDLSTPDYDVMYANEARAKEQQLKDAGYTVDTGFDGQVVIKDSSGVTLPRNLTASMILDRALGRAPRTNLVARTDYATAKQGGLISLKNGGEFSGMVPGNGHGMEDNVYMPIVEKENGSQVGTLAVSPSEYVVDSYTMAALGNGNADAGAKVMDRVVKHVRKKAYGDTEQPNEISGLEALKPMMERV